MSKGMDFGKAEGNVFEIYDRHLVPAVFGPWTPRLIELAEIKEGERVLDVACGTGVAARLAAQRVGSKGAVTGLDIAPGMLEVARSSNSVSGATIEWREGDACALSYEDSQFDLVLCQLGLMFFADKAKALREMYRVLTPEGRVSFLVWRSIRHSPGYAVLADALNNHVSSEASSIMHTPFVFGDEDQELETLVTHAGFRDVRVQADSGPVRFKSPEEFVQLYISGTPLASHFAEVDDNAQAALMSEVNSGLQSHVKEEGLEFPIEGHLVFAKK